MITYISDSYIINRCDNCNNEDRVYYSNITLGIIISDIVKWDISNIYNCTCGARHFIKGTQKPAIISALVNNEIYIRTKDVGLFISGLTKEDIEDYINSIDRYSTYFSLPSNLSDTHLIYPSSIEKYYTFNEIKDLVKKGALIYGTDNEKLSFIEKYIGAETSSLKQIIKKLNGL